MSTTAGYTESPGGAVGHEHPDVTGGWLRPAVFGAMDGLVSNFALLSGMAGGTGGDNQQAVVLAGLAGLAAGAFSMAAGEYTSVASQSEFATQQVQIERREIMAHPDTETAELAQMYVGKGVDAATARRMAAQVHTDIDRAVSVHAMEEFGVDPDDLPSPALAALSSFFAFAAGAAVPLLPYLAGATVLLPGLLLTLIALFGCGAVVARVTSRPWWYSGLRQLVLGGLAAGVTYLFGSLVGASLG
ncbi:MAG TPA: VIT1/CCC1 transporter family protein [Nocardioidaceae bacterium]|nr:VIT1/CCC1 transporter family protein [Nocardioidaceae bacterium]